MSNKSNQQRRYNNNISISQIFKRFSNKNRYLILQGEIAGSIQTYIEIEKNPGQTIYNMNNTPSIQPFNQYVTIKNAYILINKYTKSGTTTNPYYNVQVLYMTNENKPYIIEYGNGILLNHVFKFNLTEQPGVLGTITYNPLTRTFFLIGFQTHPYKIRNTLLILEH